MCLKHESEIVCILHGSEKVAKRPQCSRRKPLGDFSPVPTFAILPNVCFVACNVFGCWLVQVLLFVSSMFGVAWPNLLTAFKFKVVCVSRVKNRHGRWM